jgi:hypothetical protein
MVLMKILQLHRRSSPFILTAARPPLGRKRSSLWSNFLIVVSNVFIDAAPLLFLLFYCCCALNKPSPLCWSVSGLARSGTDRGWEGEQLSQRVPQAASSDRRPLDLRSVTDSSVTELAA